MKRCAWSENRTRTPLRELDFESNASTSSAIQAQKERWSYQRLLHFSIPRAVPSSPTGDQGVSRRYCRVATISLQYKERYVGGGNTASDDNPDWLSQTLACAKLRLLAASAALPEDLQAAAGRAILFDLAPAGG